MGVVEAVVVDDFLAATHGQGDFELLVVTSGVVGGLLLEKIVAMGVEGDEVRRILFT